MNDFIAPDFNPGAMMGIDCGKCRRYGRFAFWIISFLWLHNPCLIWPNINPSHEMDRAYGTKRKVARFKPRIEIRGYKISYA